MRGVFRRLFRSGSGLGRLVVTLVAVAAAGLVGRGLWVHYMDDPWTRDGRVWADVLGVAPDVSGLVSDVLVRDNQAVIKGQVLFRVDKARFTLALRQAEAVVASRQSALEEAMREMNRYRSLTNAEVSVEKQQQTTASAQQAAAAYQQAVADRDVARLNLDRTDVVAPVNGIITNFDLRPGDYVSTGKAVTAMVDTDSLRVEGYFEETKLPRIGIGDVATVRLMGWPTELTGRVESIAAGIEDPNRSAGANLLANVNPTFSWVRLAQRIPVRVRLDPVPQGVRLVVGQTATVAVRQPDGTAARTATPVAGEPRPSAPPAQGTTTQGKAIHGEEGLGTPPGSGQPLPARPGREPS